MGLLALALSAAPLIGCTSVAKFTAFEAGDVPIGVKLPSICEAFLQPAEIPPWINRNTDARVAFPPVADALVEDTKRMTAAGSCFADERQAYAQKGKTK